VGRRREWEVATSTYSVIWIARILAVLGDWDVGGDVSRIESFGWSGPRGSGALPRVNRRSVILSF